MIVGVVALHVWALHVSGNNNPVGIRSRPNQDMVPFHPYYTVKDGFALSLVVLVYAALVFYAPNLLGHADNYIPANPLVTPAHIVPEWYLLPFYAILRAIPDKLGGVIAMFGAIGVLFFLPWLDKSEVRSARFRPWFRPLFFVFLADCLLLGYLGARTPEGIYVVLARLGTAYYFAHFLVILPLLGRLEPRMKLPTSIAAPIGRGAPA